MNIKKITIPLVLFISLTFYFVWYCSLKEKHNFIVMAGPEPDSFDPQVAYDVTSNFFIDNMFIGLVNTNQKTGYHDKGLAEGWSMSKNFKFYRFFLRDNIYWSDGVPITAKGIKESFIRILKKESGEAYGQIIIPIIKNGTEFSEGLVDEDQLGIKVINDRTLEIELTESVPYFITMLAYSSFYPVPMHVINKYNKDWTDPKHIVVSGAFTLKELARKQIVLEKNTYYHKAQNVEIDNITFITIKNQNETFKMYEKNQIDLIIDLNSNVLEQVKGRNDFYLHKTDSLRFYSFNTTKKPLNDSRVREAFALAIDKEMLTIDLLKNDSIATRNLNPRFKSYKLNKHLTLFNKKKAQRLLREAGFPNGKGFPDNLIITYNSNESYSMIAKFIQKEWKNNLNIDVKLKEEDEITFQQSKESLNYTIRQGEWTADYDDATTFLNIFTTENKNLNGSGYSNPEFDKLIEASNTETDPIIRQNLLRTAEKMIIEQDFQIIPLFFTSFSYLFKNDKWTGWCPNPALRYQFENIKPIKRIKFEYKK